MFLVSGPMPHEAVWTRWLKAVEGKLPAAVLCNAGAMACLDAMPKDQSHPVLAAQYLYTMYVHTKPEFPGYPKGSLFHNRAISTLLPVRTLSL